MHFLILLDATLHVAIIALSFFVVYYACRFIKCVKEHPNTTNVSVLISYVMLLIAGYMVYCSVHSAIDCAIQYHSWWNR